MIISPAAAEPSSCRICAHRLYTYRLCHRLCSTPGRRHRNSDQMSRTAYPDRMSSKAPCRWRTRLRRNLPWFLINLGIASKGRDCEAVGGEHEWYNRDNVTSGCYHCEVVREGRLWERDPHVEHG